MRPMRPMRRVAYLVNQYPKVSHSFIRREILALESEGVVVDRYAIRGWAEETADPADATEQAKTHYLLQGGAKRILSALIATVSLHPRRFFQALLETLRLSRGGERSLFYHLIYLGEAAVLFRYLRASGAEHVHAHFGTNSTNVALLAHRLGGPGYSFTVHGPEEFDKPASIGLARKIEASRFVVAVSSFGRSQLFRWVSPALWSRVQVVHCGLEPAFFGSVPSERVFAQPSMSDFVCVGRICEQKGQILIVDALGLLKARGLTPSVTLAGDGPMRADIERRAAGLGVSDQIRITGWIGGDQVRAELQNARIMVLPSFAEGLPVAIMEAMALRRPVISTYVAGIPELVQPGKTGWLVPAGDAYVLADAMFEALCQTPESYGDMGDRARERVLDRHDVRVEARKLSALFEQAVKDAQC